MAALSGALASLKGLALLLGGLKIERHKLNEELQAEQHFD